MKIIRTLKELESALEELEVRKILAKACRDRLGGKCWVPIQYMEEVNELLHYAAHANSPIQQPTTDYRTGERK